MNTLEEFRGHAGLVSSYDCTLTTLLTKGRSDKRLDTLRLTISTAEFRRDERPSNVDLNSRSWSMARPWPSKSMLRKSRLSAATPSTNWW